MRLSSALGALAIASWVITDIFSADLAVTSSELTAVRRDMPDVQWLFGLTTWVPFATRDWGMIIAVLAFTALNMFVWTLPITQMQLFLISFPAGFAAIITFLWYVGRD